MGDENVLWRECVRWMVDCGILDRQHTANWPTAELFDFAQILRDGVLLCQVANRLVRGCIDTRELSLRPQLSQFLCLKNICLFLGACQSTFNIPQRDLFEAWELYKVSDFGKVLTTLSKLSKSEAALRTGIQGFPAQSTSSPIVEYYNDEIYRNLEEEAGKKELEEKIYDTDDDEGGRIYDSLILHNRRKITPQISNAEPTEFVPVDKRGHCIKELQDTELNYVEALKMIQNKFYAPLKEVLTAEDHETIFINILELSQIHTSFNLELSRAVRLSVGMASQADGNSAMRIGEVFVRWKNHFVAYSKYCANLPASRALIERYENENREIRQKIADCGFEANRNQFRLQDLLSVPMQRVLKYHILLSELIKLTPIEHPDRPSLDKAKEAMMDINSYINEVKRDCETTQIIKDIQNSILDLEMPENTNLIDYGRLLKDGEIKIADHGQRDGHKIKSRYVFVFDKVMLICKTTRGRGNQYTYKSAQVIGEYKIEHSEPENMKPFDTLRSTMGRKWLFSWSLVHTNGANVIQMYAKSMDQKVAWMQALESANDNVRPRAAETSGHELRYHTYKDATECSHCCKLLAGLFYQGYRCDICESNLHKRCIELAGTCSGRAPAPALLKHKMSVLTSNPSATIAVGERVRAVHAFNMGPNQHDYLVFDENDLIEVLELGHDGWWKGRIIEGRNRDRVGYFKGEYVRKSRHSFVGAPNRRSVSSISCAPNFMPDSPPVVPASRLVSSFSTESSSQNSPRRTPSILSQNSLTQMTPTFNGHEYVNTDVKEQPWYMGDGDRIDAQNKLSGLPDGAFLVRYSNAQDRYAVSISYEKEVKHVKVESGEQGFWLDESLPFPTVVDLIKYYQEHNLQESFTALNTTLKRPYRDYCMVIAVAIHDFTASDEKMVSLTKGDRVQVIDTQGEQRGWWKGKVNGKIGYFPLTYVSPIEHPISPTR